MLKHFSFLILLFVVKSSIANSGDTTTIRTHNATHWNWYGSIDSWTQFPDTSYHYRKITLKYKLGCPSSGCSDWDYTTQIFIRRHTGQMDSTLSYSPYFTANGNAVDSVLFNSNPVYVYFYNSNTNMTDSTLASPIQIISFQDSLNPTIPTDTLIGYTGNYYNYLYDTTGTIIDSVWVGTDSTLYNGQYNIYTPFEIIEHIEIARYITPYGGALANTWNNTWEFDITDYASLLHDSVDIRAFYSGWSDGFTVTLDFEMIEGIAPRTAKRVETLWTGYFPYGDPNNPIENYLTPKMKFIAADEVASKVYFNITGHGFGGNEDCAEFCPKNCFLKTDGQIRYTQLVWRETCGLNSLYPQAGTWLYDRANWCPGDRVYPYQFEITPFITPSDSVLIDVDMQSFTNVGNNSCGYQIDGQLITYGAPNFTVDAELIAIVAPNKIANNQRFNPICGKPIVVIRNTGSTTLTSLVIDYGVSGTNTQSYTWNGSLAFLETDTVYLPNLLNWYGNAAKFSATISSPNAGTDQLADNNSLTVAYVAPIELVADLVFEVRTNLAAWETYYELTDANGTVWLTRSNLANSTNYRDTLHLPPGCYKFRMIDAGKDGLSFWANNSGSGYARIKKATGTIVKPFVADFGSEIYYEFTVGYNIGMSEPVVDNFLEVYPNPGTGVFNIDYQSESDETEIVILDATGRVIRTEKLQGSNGTIRVDLSGNPSGLYFVQMRTQNGVVTKRVVLQ
jgi:Peptide-N-glycosidase F, C terminal/Secretion system C-terminal sorting domain/Peptide-N-glycosidase F, N terminal